MASYHSLITLNHPDAVKHGVRLDPVAKSALFTPNGGMHCQFDVSLMDRHACMCCKKRADIWLLGLV
jgi:hypothetical protein